MKKTISLAISAITLMFALNSCGSNDSNSDNDLSFSTLTVEQQKQSIEQSGTDFKTAISNMQQTSAFKAIIHLTELTNRPLYAPLSKLRADLLKNDTKALNQFSKQLKVLATNDNGLLGVEDTWNRTKQDFDETKIDGNKAIVHFPASANSSSNNATITVTLVNSSAAAPANDEGLRYLPATISVVMTVDSKEVFNAQYSATYTSDGRPSKVTQSLTVEKFNWLAELSYNTSKATMAYEFKYDGATLIKYEFEAAGNFTEEALENAETKPEDVFSSASVNFQIMNIAVKGEIADFKGMANEAKTVDDNGTKVSIEQEAAIINKYCKMYAYFVKENQKFAEVEIYAALNHYSYYELQPRMVLSDGSKVSFDTYFQSGFSSDLISSFNQLFNLLSEEI